VPEAIDLRTPSQPLGLAVRTSDIVVNGMDGGMITPGKNDRGPNELKQTGFNALTNARHVFEQLNLICP